MDALSENFDIQELHDEYREAVEELIESKTEGRVPATAEKPAPASNVVDITAMLKRSIEAQTSRRSGGSGGSGGGRGGSGGGAAKKAAAKKTAPKKTAAKRTTAAKKTA